MSIGDSQCLQAVVTLCLPQAMIQNDHSTGDSVVQAFRCGRAIMRIIYNRYFLSAITVLRAVICEFKSGGIHGSI